MGLQSGMIEFEVDQTQLQRIELKLKDMKAKAPQALKNARMLPPGMPKRIWLTKPRKPMR